MELEVYSKSGLDCAGMVLHRIDGLYLAIRQGVYKFKGREAAAVYIFDKGLILLPLRAVSFYIRLTPARQFYEVFL